MAIFVSLLVSAAVGDGLAQGAELGDSFALLNMVALPIETVYRIYGEVNHRRTPHQTCRDAADSLHIPRAHRRVRVVRPLALPANRGHRMSAQAGPPPMVQAAGASKWFGDLVAVSDVSFNIGAGVTALLGPNGAGKSTMLRMMCGLARPSNGSVTVLGKDPRSDVDPCWAASAWPPSRNRCSIT